MLTGTPRLLAQIGSALLIIIGFMISYEQAGAGSLVMILVGIGAFLAVSYAPKKTDDRGPHNPG